MTKADGAILPFETDNTTYPFFTSHSTKLRVAEDNDDYAESTSIHHDLQSELKCAELRALRAAASGQVGRLYRLANLLQQEESFDQTQDDRKQIAFQIRDAASILEDTVHAIVGPMVEDPEPLKEEIAD